MRLPAPSSNPVRAVDADYVIYRSFPPDEVSSCPAGPGEGGARRRNVRAGRQTLENKDKMKRAVSTM